MGWVMGHLAQKGPKKPQIDLALRLVLGPPSPNDPYPTPFLISTQNMRFEAKLMFWWRIPLRM